MLKKIISLVLGISVLFGMTILPADVSAASEIFIDEYDTKKNPGITKAFYSSNLYEVSSTQAQLGDYTRASRLVAEEDGVVVYKHEDVSAICMQGSANGKDGKDFLFYYSQDNENWIEISPFYFQEVQNLTNTYIGGNYYFVGFPSGTIYFKIVLPATEGHYNYNRQINYTKIESGGITLLSSLDISLRNQAEATLADDSEFMKKTETIDCGEALRLLYHLGAIDNSFLKEEKLNSKITKGEFANALAQLINYPSEWPEIGSYTKFSDVSASTPYAAAITMVTDMGYMTGDADGSFRPNSYIKTQDAIQTVLFTLGYKKVLETKSVSYVAKMADLNYSIPERELTGKGTINLLFSMLNAHPVKYVDDGFGISDAIYMTDILKIMRKEGQLTGTIYGSVLTEKSPRKGEVRIDAATYTVSSAYLDSKLGQRIYFYIELDGEDNKIISYGVDNVNNEAISLQYEDLVISSCNSSRIAYEDEKGKMRRVRISIDFFVVNGGRVTSFDIDDVTDNDFITLYDNDDNGVYETVIAEKYDELWVKDIYSEDKIITGYYGEKNVSFNEDDYTNINYLRNGRVSGFNDINERDVLSVAQSADKEYLKVIINRQSIEGNVSKTSSDGKVTIGDDAYRISRIYLEHNASGYADDIEADSGGTYYLNAFGEIAAYSSNTLPKRYGYIVGTKVEEFFVSTLWLRIFDESGEMLDLECRPTVSIECQGGVARLNGSAAASKLLTYNHMVNSVTGNVEGLIQYKTDREGKIHTIYVPSNLPSKEYFSIDHKNTSAYTNGSDVIDMSYKYGADTKIFVVPYDRNNYDEYTTEYTFLSGYQGSSNTYNLTLYDINEERFTPVLLMEKSELDGDNLNLNYQPLSFVSDIRQVWDAEKQENQLLVKLIVNGVENSYYVTENLKLRLGKTTAVASDRSGLTVADLKIGDCVQFATGADGKICKMTVFFQNETDTFYLSDGTAQQTLGRQKSGEFSIIYGKVVSCNTPYLLLETDEGLQLLKVHAAKIGVYYDGIDQVRMGFVSAMAPGDHVVLRTTRTDVNTLLILKDW